jgi:fission 1 protein
MSMILLRFFKLYTEIYTDAPERRRECLYFLAIGNFKISNYGEARRFNDQLLKLEPRNDQGLALKQLIDEKVSTGIKKAKEEK